MPAIHPGWSGAQTQVVRFVTVAGKQLAVNVTDEDGRYVAMHAATGCWGVGATVEAAMEDAAMMLANDREWFCTGAGARLYLDGRAWQRRAAVQACFGGKG